MPWLLCQSEQVVRSKVSRSMWTWCLGLCPKHIARKGIALHLLWSGFFFFSFFFVLVSCRRNPFPPTQLYHVNSSAVRGDDPNLNWNTPLGMSCMGSEPWWWKVLSGILYFLEHVLWDKGERNKGGWNQENKQNKLKNVRRICSHIINALSQILRCFCKHRDEIRNVAVRGQGHLYLN